MITKKNTLVVPIRLEALAVNEGFKGRPVRRWCMDYSRLLHRSNPEAPPFDEDIEIAYFDNPDNWGVYLHWMVPEALRQGEHEDKSEADFPALPNRWLVSRIIMDSAENSVSPIKSWLIKSDALGAETGGGSTFAYMDRDGRVREVKLGSSAEVDGPPWDLLKKEPATFYRNHPEIASPQSLNALGFGDVNFLAYQPFINDVFSFHDDLSDIRENDKLKINGQINYFVAGWHSHPEDDALYQACMKKQISGNEVLKIFEAFNWQVTGTRSGTDADGYRVTALLRTLYYGRLYQVDWSSASHIETDLMARRRDSEMSVGDPAIALGNNAIDALTALLEKTDSPTINEDLTESLAKADLSDKREGMLQFLRPFSYGLLQLLKETGGHIRLNQEIRKTWFKAKAGGLCWILEPENPSGPPGRTLKESVKTILEQLNVRQEEIEQIQRELEELQKLLYDAWWLLKLKIGKAGDEKTDAESIKTQIEELKNSDLAKTISSLKLTLNQKIFELAKLFNDLLHSLSGKNETFSEIKADDIDGIKKTLAELQEKLHKEYGLVEKAKPPFWKVHDPTVLIAGISPPHDYRSGAPLVCIPADQLPGTGTDSSNDNLLTTIFNHFTAQYNDYVAQRQFGPYSWQWPWNPLWVQPWRPLFLEWEAEWFALSYQRSGEESQKRFWKLTASDYQLKLEPDELHDFLKEKPKGQIIRGRTFLTPQNNELLMDQMEKLEEMTPQNDRQSIKFGSLKKFVESIARPRYYSQSLLDFNNRLQSRTTQLSIIPGDENLADLIGEQYQSQPFIPPSGPSDCQGMRQGYFKINKLQVYDGFGQCLVLEESPESDSGGTFTPLADNNLTPAVQPLKSEPLIELKPRILDYARLRFDFVDAKEEDKIIDIQPDVNPIIGWVLYNHLDKSLVLFDSGGIYLGELRVAHGSVTRIDLDKKITERFQAVIDHIPTNAQIFNLFLNIIDETLWTIEPNASLQEQHLAVWLGRPLALVRTRLRFEICGFEKRKFRKVVKLAGGISLSKKENPVYFKQAQQQFQDYEFNIRLGSRGIRQDGLIGYYFNKAFNTVHDLKVVPPNYAEYIKPINDDNLIPLSFFDPIHLTLLVDPRAAVYAQTGILPYTSLQLPSHLVDQALEKIQVNFRYHCLLTRRQMAAEEGGRERLIMPLPALRKGTWEWVEKQIAAEEGGRERPIMRLPALRKGTGERVENGEQKFFDIQGIPATGKISDETTLLREGRLVLLDPFREEKK